MDMEKHSFAGALTTSLFLETIRLNGRLLASGDRLVAGLGLTSARWQVLGAVVMAERPMPVPHIARQMGLSRQNVQRIVNDLDDVGYVTFAPNPHHKRAKLVVLTDRGRETYDAAHRVQVPWANALGAATTPEDLQTALRVLQSLRAALDKEQTDPAEQLASTR
jgi:DNA-binding MarR family transcriptional regulator